MPVDITSDRSDRFVDHTPLYSLGALLMVAIAVVISPFFARTLLEQEVTLVPNETVTLEPIRPQSIVGAVRIEARANIPRNSWLTLELKIFDDQDNLLASGIKQVWQESGTWQEDGESGTWSDRDVIGQLDFRPPQIGEPMVLAVTAVDQGRTSGEALDTVAIVDLTVREGVVDRRFLWMGLAGAGIAIALTTLLVKKTGRTVICERMNDSDVSGVALTGGADKLLRLQVDVVSDENTPPKLEVDLAITDDQGEKLYGRRFPLALSFKREKGRVDSAQGKFSLDLVLEPQVTYTFVVEVVPDGPVDWTTLTVREGVRPLQGGEVRCLRVRG